MCLFSTLNPSLNDIGVLFCVYIQLHKRMHTHTHPHACMHAPHIGSRTLDGLSSWGGGR